MLRANPYYLLLFLVALIWSTTNFITKDLLSNLGPFTILIARFSIPVLFLTSILLIQRKNIFKDFKIGLLTGIFLALFYSLQNLALVTTSPVNTSFFLNSFVIFVPFLAYFIEKKKLNILDFVTVGLAITGLYLIAGNLGGFKFGDILALLGALFYAFYMVLVNNYASKEDVLVEVNQQFLVVTIVAIIGHYVSNETFTATAPTIQLQLLYLAIFPTLTCFLLLNWSEKKVNPLLSSLIISLDAVLTAIFGLITNQIEFSWLLILGIVIFQLAIISDSPLFRNITKKN